MAGSNEDWRGKRPEAWGGDELMGGDTPDVVWAGIDERTRRAETAIDEIKTMVQTHYVPAAQFKCMKEKVDLHQKILFTVIGLISLTVVAALIKLVMLPHGGAT